MNKLVKYIVAGVGTIIIGGLGSGVWERILSPLLDYVVSGISTLLSYLSSSYDDSIYQKAASIADEGQVTIFMSLMFTLLAFFWLCKALSTKPDNEMLSSFHTGLTSAFRGWYGIVFSASTLVFSMVTLSTNSAIYQVRNNSIDNINIARPYIGDERYHKLYSQFLQIKSKEDFVDYQLKIESYSVSYRFTLKATRK
ncbi:hypothetical protein JKP10_21085 [Vibrio vulnificus]|uniref:hypothetical protein n=1 Tax=Vibrio TaxID=662 RepID=UPI000C7CE79B|nr:MULTISPECIES: hypothetical protein [Vibrio]EHU5198728.1 hypothetical protein [Vibrio vulnificus]EJR3609978.1 hypothetical protein [Vibrio vulnificus]EJV9309760.1 hypothetical protein [Vibrio vulnificus]ELK2256434.1 hypothetical protein [Vibrio vulnificus]ELS3451419.1 hypothetical protein [Vibrio vulnificus]